MKKFLSVFLILWAFASSAQLPSYLPSNGLVAWYPFNGNANDASGNGNNGTVNGATLTTDRNGNANGAYNFDGVSNKINFGNTINILNVFSVSFWLKTSMNCPGTFPAYGMIITKDNTNAGIVDWSIGIAQENKIAFKKGNSNTSDFSEVFSSTAINDNIWHYVVVVNSNINSKIYVDGILNNSVDNLAFNLTNNLTNLVAGYTDLPQISAPIPKFLNGALDDIAIYNRALTQQEITALYTGVPKNACLANIIQSDTAICAGQSITLTASSVTPQIVTDINGNIYPTVNIGNQTWLQKNLNVSRYRNGDIIPQVTNPVQWATLTTGAWCWYNNDSANYAAVYGRLYNWYALTDSRGIAPNGWHIPTNQEWTTLTDYLGGTNVAGGKLKEIDTILWASPNQGATNSSLFTALPCGFRGYNGNFNNSNLQALFWTFTQSNQGTTSTSGAWFRLLYNSNSSVGVAGNLDKYCGLSVRAVRDNFSNPTFLWSNGGNTPDITVYPTQNTTYYVTVNTGLTTCHDSVKVNVISINSNFFPQDTIKVCGTFYILDAGPGNTYRWNTGANSQSIGILASGWYKCTVTTNNCIATDSVFVSLVNANIINNDTAICAGNSVTLSIGNRFAGKSLCNKSELPANLQNGLVGFYPFCGNANDQSGNNNNGTNTGATLTSNRYGEINNAYFFNGTNNYIDLPAVFNSPSFTLSVWGNSDLASSFCSPCHVLFSKISNPNPNNNFELRGPNEFIYGDGTGNGSNYNLLLFNSNNLTLGSWYHVVVSYDATLKKASIYLNGVLSNTVTGGGLTNLINQAAAIGARPGTHELPFYGKIDDVFFYNRVISNSEVLQLYNLGSTISWSTGASSPSISVTPTQSTTYYVTVSNGTSTCTDSVRVTVNSVPRNFFAQDTIKACGTAYTLDAGTGSVYSWSTGETTRTKSVTITGWYKCTVTNTSGCVGTDSVFVSLVNANIVNNDTSVCQGSNVLLIKSNTRKPNISVLYLPSSNGIIQDTSKWHYVALTKSGLTGSFYLDGNLIRTSTFVDNPYIWNSLLLGATQGCVSCAPVPNFNGRLDELRVSSVARTSAEIANVYSSNSQFLSDASTLELFHFDTAYSNTIKNVVNGTTGTLYGGAGYDVGKFGLGISFNGLDGYARYSQSIPVNNMSIEFWYKSSDTSATLAMMEYAYNTGISLGMEETTSSTLWSTGATTPSISVTPTQSTTYYLTVSNGISSCKDSVRVTVNPVPNNFFAQDTIKACGTAYTLDVGTGSVYSWSTGETTRTKSVTTTGWYKCTVTNTSGCVGTDSVFVSLVNANIVNNDTAVCQGSNVLLSTINTRTPNISVLYLPSSNGIIQDTSRWHYVALTKSGLTGSFYLDGNLIKTSTFVDNPYIWNSLLLGATQACVSCAPTPNFSGKLDELRVSSVARTSAEIASLFSANSQFSSDASTLELFHFDTAYSNTIKNVINGTTGTLYGGAGYDAGKFGLGVSFNGLDGYARYSQSIPVNNMSIEFWYKSSDTSATLAMMEYAYNTGISLGMQETPLTSTWSTGATTPTITVTPTQSTTYYLTVSNGISSCKDSVRITVNPVNRNFFAQDTIKACGTSYTLNAGTGTSYLWNTGATARTLAVTNSGWYKCKVTTGVCSETDSVFVSITRANILNNDTTINRSLNLTLQVDTLAGVTPRPQFLWSTGATTTSISVFPLVTTTYYCTVSNGISTCTDSVKITVNDKFNLSAPTLKICGPQDITAATTVDVPITVKVFNSIVGFQGSIKWDSTVLKYQSTFNFAPSLGLSSGNFNNASANTLLYSWLDVNLTGQTLPDSSVLFTIRYNIVPGAWGKSTAIQFANTPNVLEAIQEPAKNLIVLTQSGLVSIGARPVLDTLRISGCGNVVYLGTNYTSSVNVSTTLRNTSGCDSIYRTAIISVTPIPVISAVTANSPLFIGDNLQFNVAGQNLTGATYSWTGPNSFTSSVQNPTLTATAASSGQYRLIFNQACKRDTQYVSVTVNAGISGRVITPLRQPVSRVNLLQNNQSSLINGSYALAVNPALPLVLKASKNNDVNKSNGVSAIDIVLIQNHILQRSLLGDPYKLIAADVNKSGTISTLDLLYIKRLILGLDTTYPGNNLWSFVDSSYVFPNPANPFPYKDSFSYNAASLQSNKTNQTFLGVKLGDVNYDWDVNQARPVPSDNIELFHEDVWVKEGNEIHIPVRVRNFKELLGLQFTLNFNHQKLRFNRVEKNPIQLRFATNRLESGKMSFVWTEDYNVPTTLLNDALLMELVFDKVADFSEEELTLSADVAAIEAWDKQFAKHFITKGSGKIKRLPDSPIWSVRPNPTKGNVFIHFVVRDKQKVHAELTDNLGRIVFQQENDLPAGVIEWRVDLQQKGMLPPGIYYLRIPEIDKQIKKLVIIK